MKGLALEGGGVCGIGHIGVLQVLEERGILDELTHFVGASAGAIVAALLACKVSITNITKILFDLDFNEFKDSTYTGYFGDMYRLYSKYGWYKGEALEKWLENIIGDITLEQVHEKYGTWLELAITDVSIQSTIYVNHTTHPELQLKTAVRRSAGLPVFFQVETNGGNMYIDGGLLDNYPIQRLYNVLPKEECIGIKLISKENVTNQAHTPHNFEEYLWTIFSMTRMQALKTHINEDDWSRTIKVDVGDVSITDFSLSDVQKEALVQYGRNGAIAFFTC